MQVTPAGRSRTRKALRVSLVALAALFVVDSVHLVLTILNLADRTTLDVLLHVSSALLATVFIGGLIWVSTLLFSWNGLLVSWVIALIVMPALYAAALFVLEGTHRGTSMMHLTPVFASAFGAMAMLAVATWPWAPIVLLVLALVPSLQAKRVTSIVATVVVAAAAALLLGDRVLAFIVD